MGRNAVGVKTIRVPHFATAVNKTCLIAFVRLAQRLGRSLALPLARLIKL